MCQPSGALFTDSPNLAAYVVWVPKNGAREEHVSRVTGIVTDERVQQYWDGLQAVMQPYHERYELTGPCAGLFMVFGPDAEWGANGPPEPEYVEDAHARQYNRRHVQFDGKRFAAYVMELLR